MPRHVTLRPHLPSDELERRYRSAHEPHERSWWQMLWLLSRGQSARQVAQSTGYSPYWIGQLAKRYNTEGPDGMRNRARLTSHRQAPLLSLEQQEELRQALTRPPPGGTPTTRWSGRRVALWMSERVGRPVAVQRGYDYLQRHVRADAAAQAQFKKSSARS
jgi:transposase